MNVDLDKLDVNKNEAESRFEATVEGILASIEYQRHGDTIIFTHTTVPEALSGKGVAGKLAQTALDYSRAHSLKVVPVCPYVFAYLKRHPEYHDLVRTDYRSQLVSG